MRIVAGAARGRRLTVPKGSEVRPTADRVKEALFSSLQPLLPGASVLDLFAGSGALGLEALSRGADQVTFIERAPAAISTIERNIDIVGLPGTAIIRAEVAAALATSPVGAPFDLVLIDPPYKMTNDEVAVLLSALLPHLAEGATVSVERAKRDEPPEWPQELQPDEPRRYGDTTLHRAWLRDGADPQR